MRILKQIGKTIRYSEQDLGGRLELDKFEEVQPVCIGQENPMKL